MANPSLQIGNDNWAIKEDNLLGYSTAGTRFVPQPITMTRATLGTRVNPSGLVEDVALLGSENIDLTTGSTTSPSNWGSITTNGISYLAQIGTVEYYDTGFTVTSGLTYKLTFTLSNYTGSNNLGFSSSGGVSSSARLDADGSYSEYFIASSSVELKMFGRNTATGVFTNVSVKEATIDNLPRVDYTDGTSSLLVEPQRTNLIPYSEAITQANGYSPYDVTLASNQGTTPMGTNNATKLTSTGADPYIQYAVPNTNATFTLSVYAKGVGSSVGKDINFYLIRDNYADVVQSSQFTLTNEWVRYTATLSLSTNPTTQVIYRIDAPSVGVAGDEVLIWGAQLEEGSYATSYIPTSGGTVTRVQETYEKTGISDKIGQTEGTFFIELSKPVLSPDNYITISLNNAASNSIDNTLTIGFKNSNEYYIRLRAGGTSAFTSGNTASLANTFYKIAVSYKSTESLIYIDGSPITPNGGSLSNAFAFTATLDNLSFDLDGDDTSPFYGNVKQLQIFKTALSPSELTTLTT